MMQIYNHNMSASRLASYHIWITCCYPGRYLAQKDNGHIFHPENGLSILYTVFKWIVHSLYSILNAVEIHRHAEIAAGEKYIQPNREETQMVERLKPRLHVQFSPLA